MQLPKPTHTKQVCHDVSEWIAIGGPCPMCQQKWIRFPDFEELLHRNDCSYIASADYHAVVDEAVQAVLEAASQ